MDQQPFLFSDAEMRQFGRPQPPPEFTLDAPALQQWKAKISEFQAQVRQRQTPQQLGLWEQPGENGGNQGRNDGMGTQTRKENLPIVTATSPPVDPFQLDLQNFFFFQWPIDRNPSDPCLYFVLDTAADLVLYIGETCHVNQRWAGYHDCKRYVLNYQSAHFQFKIRTMINIGFWWDTPIETRPRQNLEASLIKSWRSPFNKENWTFWGTPFVHH